MRFDPKKLEQFPLEPGVYLMKNEEGEVLYVGKAKELKKRLKSYFAPGRDERPMVPHLVAQVALIDTILVSTEKEALLLENTLIKKHQPKFNAVLKDDKTFISLMINHKHKWPRLSLVRNKGKPKEEGLYFGPYTSALAARETYEMLTRLFPMRQCSDEELKRRKRPCLLYGIKRCIAPCVGLCTKEEYDHFVQGAIHFLKGENKTVLKELHKEMEKASEAQEFEKAAAFLQTIRQIEHVLEKGQIVAKNYGKDCDVLALYRHGEEVILMQLLCREGKLVGSEHYTFYDVVQEDEALFSSFLLQHYKEHSHPPSEILLPLALPQQKEIEEILFEAQKKKIHLLVPQKGEKEKLVSLAEKNAKATFQQEKNAQELREKMLLDLAETCKLNRYPKRIECFDTSNIAGSDQVACLVAFTDGQKDSARTRLFRIRDIKKGDDYGALHQVLSRRLIRAKEEDDLPDLIIVDGGKGQLHVAQDVFKELDIANVDLIAIAKEAGRHDKGMTQERLFLPERKEPLILSIRSPLLFLLQMIRDEAHRKAIGFHKTRRTKRYLTSALDEIPGIGKTKKMRLLKHFGSLERIKQATPADLAKVSGLTKKDIAALEKFFK